MKEKWWQRSVVYQIYPRSFRDSNGDGIGDLNGITEKLPYLRELGVDVIWLSPVYQSPNCDNGYDISDYRQIMSDFGTMDDFDRMLSRAHELGIRIVMDLVVNHTSDEHPWFAASRKSRENPYRDFYIWRDPAGGKEPSNLGSFFGGSAWKWDETSGQYYLHIFAEKQPDLNWENPRVRESVFAIMEWWLEKGVDGFRLDAINFIAKDPHFPDGQLHKDGYSFVFDCLDDEKEHAYLREMNRRVLSRYDLLTVGECSGVSPENAVTYANLDGSELSMVFQFEHMMIDAASGVSKYAKMLPLDLRKLKEVMSRWQTELDGKAWNSLYWDNHDQPRIVSRWGCDKAPWREVSAKMLATCLHMMQGTPYIYQGEELGMANYPWKDISQMKDIESLGNYHQLVSAGVVTPEEGFQAVSRRSRDNARTPMQWDDSENAGFTDGTPWLPVNPDYTRVNAAAELADPDSVFHYYRKLIRIRHDSDLVVHGHYALLDPENPDLWCYTRSLGRKKMLVICNFTDREVSWKIPADFAGAKLLIGNYRDAGLSEVNRPYEARVLVVR